MKHVNTTNRKPPLEERRSKSAYIDSQNITVLSSETRSILNEFENFILQDGYPCVGAQAAVNGKTYAVGIFDDMNDPISQYQCCCGLYKYLQEMLERPSDYRSYIAIFKNEQNITEIEFEKKLWSLLEQLHNIDKQYFKWDEAVCKNPNSAEFSFSFGGKGFFLVGMHPNSSRRARKFKYSAIAFNLHDQFENLREKGRFDLIKEVIRENELEFQGSINPMLSDYGKGLEAPQYSGRNVEAHWNCPFLNHSSKNDSH